MPHIDNILNSVLREKFPRIVSNGEYRCFKKKMTMLGEYWRRFPGLRPLIRKRLQSPPTSLMDDFLAQMGSTSGLEVLLSRGETVFFDGLVSFYMESLIWAIGILNFCPWHLSQTFIDWLKQCKIKPNGLENLFLEIVKAPSHKIRFTKLLEMLNAVWRWRKTLKTASGARLKIRRKPGVDLSPLPERFINKRWRGIARKFVSNYKEMKNVKAILLGGSVGCKFNDIYSDFDIWILCTCLPALREREAVLSKIRDPKSDFGHFGYFDWMTVYGVYGHAMFVRLKDQRRMLSSVRKGDPEYALWAPADCPAKWKTVIPPHTCLTGIPCHDPEKLLFQYKKELLRYPDAYRKNILLEEGRYGRSRLNALLKHCSSRDPVLFFIEWNDLLISLYRLTGNRHRKYVDRVNPKWVRHEMKSYGKEGRAFLDIVNKISIKMTAASLDRKYRTAAGLFRALSGAEKRRLTTQMRESRYDR